MKILKNIFIALLILCATACTESFLENEPDTAIPTDNVFESYALTEAALVGAYNTLSSYNFAGLYDPISSDLMGEDLKLVEGSANFGWFVNVYQMDLLPSYQWVENPWIVGYSTIYQANSIIANAYKIEDGEADDIARLEGESYALRAYSYLQLAHMYCDAYSVDADAPGLILATAPASVSEDYLTRSTLRETYELIERDLLTAAEYLAADSTSTSVYLGRLHLQAVNGLLARTYLDMERWEDASKYAQLVIDDSNTTFGTYDILLGGFATSNSETIFMLDYVQDDNNTYLSIPSFYFPVYGYSSVRATQDFYAMYDNADVRKAQYLVQDAESTPEDELIDGENVMILKFMHDGSLGNAKAIKMRETEFHLIKAEAEARLGNTADAVAALNTVQYRATGVGESSNTGDALIAEILLERRKELMGEGFRLNDIKRTQQTVTRDSDHWVKFTYAPTDFDYHRFTFPIPQSELDANNALTAADQNTGY